MKILFNIGSAIGLLFIIFVIGSVIIEAFKALMFTVKREYPIASEYVSLDASERERLYAIAASVLIASQAYEYASMRHCEFDNVSQWFV